MQITDPVADMLTRIRNANSAKHDTVDVPASNLKKAIAQILLDEGYIKAFSIVDNGNQGIEPRSLVLQADLPTELQGKPIQSAMADHFWFATASEVKPSMTSSCSSCS